MLTKFCALLLLLAAPQTDVFKKDMVPLQAAVDGVITSAGIQLMQRSHAAYIEGYGIVVSLEIAFVTPQGIFDTPRKPAEIRTLVTQRRKDLQEKVTAFVKQRVATTDSIGASDSLAIVIHVLNTNPADVPNLPVQIVLSAKKDSPQQVAVKEF
jgi:hypothetical protein